MWKVNGRRTPSDGKSSHCLWQGELKRSYHFLLHSCVDLWLTDCWLVCSFTGLSPFLWFL
jgi:hypothetical protein